MGEMGAKYFSVERFTGFVVIPAVWLGILIYIRRYLLPHLFPPIQGTRPPLPTTNEIRLQEMDNAPNCQICWDKVCSVILSPCNHLAMCKECYSA
jgi:hypothetical protein